MKIPPFNKKQVIAIATQVYEDFTTYGSEKMLRLNGIGDQYLASCVGQAVILEHRLRQAGFFQPSACIGVAAWRVGSEEGSCVGHHPDAVALGGGDFMGHAWVELQGFIIDPTTLGLRQKLAKMDSLDGRESTAEYLKARDGFVLCEHKSKVKPYAFVRDCYQWAFFYEPFLPFLSLLNQVRDHYARNNSS